jgi:hypothetical protein
MILESLKVVIPEPLVMRDPVPHRTEPRGDEAIAPLSAMPPLGYETGIAQETKVLGDGGAAHFEVCSNVADRALGIDEQIQHLASRTVTDRCEHIGLAIGNHDHAANIRKKMLTCQAQVYPLSESNAMTVEAE